MGFNSTILILNDQLSSIERDPEGFVKEMVNAISSIGCSGSKRDFHPGQSTVMSVSHADAVTILAVGGNHSTVLGRVYNGGKHYTVGDQEDLLRKLVDQHGFRLVRKSKKGKV